MEYVLNYFFSPAFREKMKRVIKRRGLAVLLFLLLAFIEAGNTQ
ncbi:hypothetical protein Fluta_1796 [Fluviicola taffensis DSM 16823]|uniref:Uncharacterized protein n=1 Tax=Fluviicola taffensis (strain DSM 16823 / NCIMB 13979 / RW262) TaxID=755732 RepID=F2II76_FLUTR|nr:hypothetical protein Fluta_1796 [Fluviicola taffensis DSM 16823]